MQATDLVVMNATLRGFWDTGWVTTQCNVQRMHWEPNAARAERISGREQLWEHNAELFLSDFTGAQLACMLVAGLDSFAAALSLP